MKFYSICIDAFPEIEDLKLIMCKLNFIRHHHVCASAFTCATMSSMISGQLGSEMVHPNGIGYNTLYDTKKFHHWRTQTEQKCILDRILTKKNDEDSTFVYIHNNTAWMNSVLMGSPISENDMNKHYREHAFENKEVKDHEFFISTKLKDKNVIYTSTNPSKNFNNFVNFNHPQLKKEFYENETKYINWLQEQRFEGVVWMDHCHWHEHVYYQTGQTKYTDENGKALFTTRDDALQDTLNWLLNFNFNEPDSFFYIYADHSHRVQDFLDPPGYLTWCYTKNNCNSSKKISLAPVIASTDFYYLLEELFDLAKLTSRKSQFAVYPTEIFDAKRIYGCEDARFNANVQSKALCFLRGCVDRQDTNDENCLWISVSKLMENGLCQEGIYVTVTKLHFKHTFTCFIFNFQENNLPTNIENFTYNDHFSVVCSGPLANRKKTKEILFDPTTNLHVLKLVEKLFLAL